MIAQLLPIPCLRGDGWSEMFPRERLWDVCGQADSVCDKCEGMRLFLTLKGGLELFNTVRETQTSLFSAFFTCLTSILMSFSRQKIHHSILCGGNRWCIDWPLVCVCLCVCVGRYVWWWEPCSVAFFSRLQGQRAILMILLRLRRNLATLFIFFPHPFIVSLTSVHLISIHIALFLTYP